MRVELAVLSFICATFLVLFLPLRYFRTNIPAQAFVIWLLFVNIVQGVNAIVWADILEVRIPVWCDIVTKLTVASKVGIPGAALASLLELERLASDRPISNDPRSRTLRILRDVFLCYAFPLLILCIHFAVQDHRFDVVKDYGCFPSTHPSNPPLVLIMGPPFLLTTIAVLTWCLIIHHITKLSSDRFSVHIEHRAPSVSSSNYNRRLIISSFQAYLCIVISVYYIFSPSWLRDFTSWTDVRKERNRIEFIYGMLDSESLRAGTWINTGVTMIYLIVAVMVGQEGKEIREMLGLGGRGGYGVRRGFNINFSMARKK
ncbi:hypothetical protein AX16_007215 [Volvariella volvacea WC 439]|nr:hypothetical protein AX16_007215 [Volvariella volvacea WC 439]